MDFHGVTEWGVILKLAKLYILLLIKKQMIQMSYLTCRYCVGIKTRQFHSYSFERIISSNYQNGLFF